MQENDEIVKNATAFIHDLSIRNNSQVVPLSVLESDEVLAKSELQISGSVGGLLDPGYTIRIVHSYRSFFSYRENISVEQLKRGCFRSDICLRNGANNIEVFLFSSNKELIDQKKFQLYYKNSFREWNETIIIAFVLALLIRGLVVQAFWIPTGSMEPTLLGEKRNFFNNALERSGDRILVSRFAYVLDFSLDGRLHFAPRLWIKAPKRGDIVVFKYPDPDPTAQPKDYIKRVIGLPGDIVEMENGNLYINGKLLEEPYIKDASLSFFTTKVEEGHLFVLGDNRNNSSDSRDWGQMPLTHLKGQAIFNYLPFNRISPIRSYHHKF